MSTQKIPTEEEIIEWLKKGYRTYSEWTETLSPEARAKVSTVFSDIPVGDIHKTLWKDLFVDAGFPELVENWGDGKDPLEDVRAFLKREGYEVEGFDEEYGFWQADPRKMLELLRGFITAEQFKNEIVKPRIEPATGKSVGERAQTEICVEKRAEAGICVEECGDSDTSKGSGTLTWHSEDFTDVHWFGECYTFIIGQQTRTIECLWEAWERGSKGVSVETIGKTIESQADRFRLAYVFRNRMDGGYHPAWGAMIRGCGKCVYGLCPPGDK
jgi:hypothetical protein